MLSSNAFYRSTFSLITNGAFVLSLMLLDDCCEIPFVTYNGLDKRKTYYYIILQCVVVTHASPQVLLVSTSNGNNLRNKVWRNEGRIINKKIG